MKATAPALAAASVLIFLSGCAVTSGTTFESVVGAEQEAAREELTTTEEIVTDDELPPLRVVTSPEGASVSLDGRRRGVTPLDVEEIERGRHLLELDAEGYHRVRRWITVPQSGSLIVEIELTPITGFLEIDVVPSDATVRVDGERLRGTFAELRIGTYDVSIERFGFRREETDVTIRRDRVTEITFDLEPAAFEIEAIDVYRRRFSPANPGTTGSTLVSYRVTAPGEGTLRITDLSGEPVRTVAQGPYATWDQEFRWDGTDESGSRVPDGTYAIEVVAHGEDGRTDRARASVTVDSSPIVRYRSVWSSAAGLLYAPDRLALPPGQAQLIGQGAGIVTALDDALVARFPARLGLRVGMGAGIELSGYGGLIAQSEPLVNRVSLGGALTWDGASVSTPAGELGGGVQLGGVFTTGDEAGRLAGPDTQANASGVFLALPLSLRIGPVGVLVTPEYRLSFAPVVYGEDPLPSNSIGHMGYLRGGVVADIDALVLGASASVRSTRFSDGLSLALPFQAGVEAHWIIPESSVALSGFAAAEIGSSADFYIMSGIGVGVLF